MIQTGILGNPYHISLSLPSNTKFKPTAMNKDTHSTLGPHLS